MICCISSPSALLPKSLIAAIERFEASGFYREALGEDVVSYLTRIKRAEWDRYLMTVSEWEQREYFSLF
jgi:glutamine synthetase